MKVVFLLIAGAMLAVAAEGCPQTEIKPGFVVQGSLDSTDCSLVLFNPSAQADLTVDVYRLVLDSDLIIQAKATSTEFEPDLLILDGDGSPIASDLSGLIDNQSVVTIHLHAGAYTLLATSMNGVGKYELSVHGEPPRSCLVQDAAPAEQISGSFDESDCRLIDVASLDTSPTALDLYRVTIDERKVISIRYASETVPAMLSLRDEAGQTVATSEEIGVTVGVLASLAPGSYIVYASSADGSLGDYKLITSVEGLRSCSPASLNAGETAHGELVAADCRQLDVFVPGANQSPTDNWQFNLNERSLVTLTMRSTEFDALLMVATKDKELIALNDDFEETIGNSQVKVSLGPGEYQALASRYAGSGPYTLDLNTEPLRSCDFPEIGAEQISGHLNSDECRILDIVTPSSEVAPADGFRLQVATKSLYSFQLRSNSFLPVLQIFDQNNVRIYTKAGTESSRDVQVTVLLAAGDYKILVSTQDSAGDYTLHVALEEPKLCQISGVLRLDGVVEGELSGTDCSLIGTLPGLVEDTKVDLYTLSVPESRKVTFSANSNAFPAMILVYDDTDTLVTAALNDKYRPRAEVTAVLPPGMYIIALTTLVHVEGAYTLTTKSELTPTQ